MNVAWLDRSEAPDLPLAGSRSKYTGVRDAHEGPGCAGVGTEVGGERERERAYSRPRCSSGGACVFLMMPTVEVPTFAGLPRRREGEQLAPRYLDLERSSERDVHDDDEREKRQAGRDLDDDAQASVAR